MISDIDINNFIDCCLNKLDENVEEIVKNFHNNGYSLVNQILKFHKTIINSKKIKSSNKALILNKLVEIDQNLIKGCDEYIQFLRLGYYIMSLN